MKKDKTNLDDLDLALISQSEVIRRTGLSRSTITRMRKAGLFPEPIPGGKKCVKWLPEQIIEWHKQLRAKAGLPAA